MELALLFVVLRVGYYFAQCTWGHNLFFKHVFPFPGVLSKAKFATLDAQKFLTQHGSFWGFFTFSTEKERLELAAKRAKHELQLNFLLQELSLHNYYPKLQSHRIFSVESLNENLYSVTLKEIFEDDDLTKLKEALQKQEGYSFEDSLPVKSATAIFSFSWWSIKFIGEFFV